MFSFLVQCKNVLIILEFSHSFVTKFHVTNFEGVVHQQRQYMLGISAVDVNEFPFYAIEEHYEMIVIDLYCMDNLTTFINDVKWLYFTDWCDIVNSIYFQTAVQLATHYKWLFVNTNNDEVYLDCFTSIISINILRIELII